MKENKVKIENSSDLYKLPLNVIQNTKIYNFEGKYFDSNVDSTKQTMAHPLETFYFVSKKEGAIQGMLEAITSFKVGSKGTLYIPSSLAYGPQGSMPVIKPYENLIFEIEVVDVKEAPKNQQPGMPPGGGY